MIISKVENLYEIHNLLCQEAEQKHIRILQRVPILNIASHDATVCRSHNSRWLT